VCRGQIASSAAILFAGGLNQSIYRDPTRPLRKVPTDPFRKPWPTGLPDGHAQIAAEQTGHLPYRQVRPFEPRSHRLPRRRIVKSPSERPPSWKPILRPFGAGPDLHSRVYPRRYRNVADARYCCGIGSLKSVQTYRPPCRSVAPTVAAEGGWIAGSVVSSPMPWQRREPCQDSGNKRPNGPAHSDGGLIPWRGSA
jgi:hypothetical protein